MPTSGKGSRLPRTTQNPLFDLQGFHRFCQPRFPYLPMEHSFEKLLRGWSRRKLLMPICSYEKIALYSSYQAWQVDRLLGRDSGLNIHDDIGLRGFSNILRLLLRIQDFYLPEVRGNLRTGLWADYGGAVVAAGPFFRLRHTYLLSYIRQVRSVAIQRRKFIPQNELRASKLDNESLISWVESITQYAEHLDPLLPWKSLVRFIAYERRQDLKGKALLAQDFYEVAEMLTLFARDLGIAAPAAISLDWQYDRYPLQPFNASGTRRNATPWELQKYGREDLARPYAMLEYLTNEFELNPKPLAIIFTEGEEWRGLRKLFIRTGIDPDLLGVEFRSLWGGGNFSLKKWQGFIEYMHEKQVLIYFVLDRENNVERQREKFIRAERMNRLDSLKKLMPGREQYRDQDRIWVWDKSFEEEFSDHMISLSLAEQGICIPRQRITSERRNKNRKRGLIESLPKEAMKNFDKGLLSESLVNKLTLAGPQGRGGREPTKPERFVWTCAQVIILNHQPIDAESRRANFETGLVG